MPEKPDCDGGDDAESAHWPSSRCVRHDKKPLGRVENGIGWFDLVIFLERPIIPSMNSENDAPSVTCSRRTRHQGVDAVAAAVGPARALPSGGVLPCPGRRAVVQAYASASPGGLDQDGVTVLCPICRQAGQKSVFDPPLSKTRSSLCFRQKIIYIALCDAEQAG